MEDAPITSAFGVPRRNGRHNGVDLGVPNGTELYAAKDGVVIQSVNRYKKGDPTAPANGNFVRINYDDGTQGVYLHMQLQKKEVVNVDDRVSAGDLIGYSNDTGHSDGPHLHYTHYNRSGQAEDPTLVHAQCE